MLESFRIQDPVVRGSGKDLEAWLQEGSGSVGFGV